jgi:hypothetical protein
MASFGVCRLLLFTAFAFHFFMRHTPFHMAMFTLARI